MPRDITERVIATPGANAVGGMVRWDPIKSLWWTGMTLGWIIGGIIWFSPSAVIAFLIACIFTLCGGHSLGMHRRFIHESFQCPHWLTLIGVWLGTLVGLGGPRTMMATHDLRDWAQRQDACHPYLNHASGPWQDFWWQVHCRLSLDNPPKLRPSAIYRNSRTLQFFQATAFAQQIPLAILLYVIGGPGFVAWAICGRVSISIFGHWAVGYVAHRADDHTPHHADYRGHFHNAGHCTQGQNVPGFGLITFGEAYHNNHHAFPESARLGLFQNQPDPGWWVLCALRKIGLVWEVVEARPNVANDAHTARPRPA